MSRVRRSTLRLLVSLCVVLPLAAAAAATRASAEIAPITVTGTNCAGSTETLSWAAPYPGVTSYQVTINETVNDFPSIQTFTVPGTQTSLPFTLPFAMLHITVSASTGGAYVGPFAETFFTAEKAPGELLYELNGSVGDGTATVTFYYEQDMLYFDDGNGSPTMTVTATPGGATMTSVPGATLTFTGLTNGVTYTFGAVATDSCGGAGPTVSAPLTPMAPTPPPTITCVVTATLAGPPAQQEVTVQSSAGLSAINHIKITNGKVVVAPFDQGTTDPVVVTATKTGQKKPTTWSFNAVDINGFSQSCA
jgi:hypothetical protein